MNVVPLCVNERYFVFQDGYNYISRLRSELGIFHCMSCRRTLPSTIYYTFIFDNVSFELSLCRKCITFENRRCSRIVDIVMKIGPYLFIDCTCDFIELLIELRENVHCRTIYASERRVHIEEDFEFSDTDTDTD